MRDSPFLAILQLWTHRDLLSALVSQELKARYRRSILGFLWTLITPIYQIVGYTIVLKYLVGMQESNLSVKILAGLLPWTFFSVSILSSCSVILKFRGVVKKVYFPRQMLPLAVVVANLVHLGLSLLVLLVLFLVIPVRFDVTFLLLPVLVLFEVLLVAGFSFAACAAHTYFQDVEYVLQNLFQVFMFFTPVLYPASKVPAVYRSLFMLNPMAVYTEGFRSVLLENHFPDLLHFSAAAAFSVVVFVAGLVVWQRFEWRFPEVI